MELQDVRYGQRIRVNLPGVGDHGQIGTVKKVRGGACSIHLDWDRRPYHMIVLYAADLDLLPIASSSDVNVDDHETAH